MSDAYSIPITSIKGVTGNPLAAAGPLQVAASALRFVPADSSRLRTMKYADPDVISILFRARAQDDPK